MEEEEGIDARNILPEGSQRTRKAPKRYRDSNYAKMMLEDVPVDEYYAALEGDCSDASIESENEGLTLEDENDSFIESDSEDEDLIEE